MENNKLLIGVQFTFPGDQGKLKHINIELYVPRDITLYQLIEGIGYGTKKLANSSDPNKHIYQKCYDVFHECCSKTVREHSGRSVLSHITLTSYNEAVAKKKDKFGDRCGFYTDEITKPICDLGFITSTRIIFDVTGEHTPLGQLDTSNIIEAFNVEKSNKVFFPEYNISSRQLYKFDTTPIDIIPPTDPPKKADRGLFFMLLPSIITIGVMIVLRMVLISSSTGSAITMVALSAAMGITAIITTVINYKRQKKEYAKNLDDWRTQYQDYIASTIQSIRERQEKDVAKLDELYPDILKLIVPNSEGVYSLNDNIFSRSAFDDDFLSFRLGLSDQVESRFEINGEDKDVVFSEASYSFSTGANGSEQVRLSLREESGHSENADDNLCKLPHAISTRFHYLHDAPLIYSLKNTGALGIVDKNIDNDYADLHYFVSRMIFELCYYHAPEDLQFVVFFNNQKDIDKIEAAITRYKFLPHFRGLFNDKSQFVFDAESANSVMSSLLTIMNSRQSKDSEDTSPSLPHIVLIVYDEHGLKEHAFAEYLPSPPQDGEEYVNALGLSFVFATKYKEYLPAYCNDIVYLDRPNMVLMPRSNSQAAKEFAVSRPGNSDEVIAFYNTFTRNVTFALRFLSAVYYAKIAQNGKVPTSVSMFDLFNCSESDIDQMIRNNWGISGKRTSSSITESLSVPIGKTETGLSFLDLHERADGPHMLVAGTTGSGKTETVITYLLGLCAKFRPDELNLLLVDMKGGGFTKRLGHLPHVVGAVTDVDGDENGTSAEYMLRRFLNAMMAEIKRRKLLFNKMKVDSIDSYIEACNNIDSHIEKKKAEGEEAQAMRDAAKDDCLSHLILVVDEFTELKRFTSENSDIDFIGEITTIARIGRSLGFHIILISQNIEGAITDDIRVNSKARLCLKVATKQASKDMIGTELAASPYMPGNGRAYLLVGTGSKFEYFQSGYSGAGTDEAVPMELILASKSGPYFSFYKSDKDNEKLKMKREKDKKTGLSKTQLEAFTEGICRVYESWKTSSANEIPAIHQVFRQPLPTCVIWNGEKAIPIIKKEEAAKRGEHL